MYKKELSYYFSTPIAYIVIGLYLLAVSLFLWVIPGQWNIIDSGYALKLIELLKGYGDVSVRLGGTMGRTAVIDASLEKVIDISKKLVPSDSLKIFHDDDVDGSKDLRLLVERCKCSS